MTGIAAALNFLHGGFEAAEMYETVRNGPPGGAGKTFQGTRRLEAALEGLQAGGKVALKGSGYSAIVALYVADVNMIFACMGY